MQRQRISKRFSASPAFDSQSRCINCAIMVNHLIRRKLVAEATETMNTLLQSWISPTENTGPRVLFYMQVTPESVVCVKCFELLESRVAIKYEECIPEYGHGNVCLPCGKSILRAPRTHNVQKDSAERNILLRLVPLHLVSRLERVCRACYTSAYREVQRQLKHFDTAPTGIGDNVPGSLENGADVLKHFDTAPTGIGDNVPGTLENGADVQSGGKELKEVEPKIISSVYRRAASTANRCIFVKCRGRERLTIPSSVRVLALTRHKLYLPTCARICRQHLEKSDWESFTSDLSDFTGEQFDIVLSVMERAVNRPFDFSNIRMMPPHLCNYWLGMNSEQFHELLDSVPELADLVPNASVALSLYLIKLRTGDSNVRLATLLNKPRATLERWMALARNCLNKVSTQFNDEDVNT